MGLQLDERSLVSAPSVADTADVANGTLRGESRRYAGREARPASADSARTTRPAKLRVAATLSADVVAIVASSLLAVWVAGAFDNVPLISRLIVAFDPDPHGGTLTFILLTPFWLAALWAFGLYREPGRSIGGMNLSESLSGLTALTAASWLMLILMVFVLGPSAPVATLIAFWMLAVVLVPAARWLSRLTVWSRAAFQERVLIIGAGEVGHTLAAKIGKHAEYRMKLVGFLDDGEPRRNGNGGVHVPVIGAFDDLDRVVAEQQVDRVIVAFSRARHNDFLRVVRACADAGVRVNIVPRLFEVVSSRALVDDVEGIPLLDVGHVELSRFNMAVKRAFDLVVGGAVFVLVLPVLGIVALVIKLESRGPVFYRQERMGRGGKPFFIYKFRSMYLGADKLRDDLAEQNDYDGPMFKIKRDPRVTRIGGWLRRWSIDEVPQIINVMKGDMSLVGPRPLWVEEAKQCRGWTQKRLDITPGITGLWQVLGRSDIPFDEMVKLDYMYVTGWSLSWDVKLLMQTGPAVVQKRGAY
jgi:exopolysaccharide biosynthesis polyprenyl glycosylphosphotransferase